MELHSESLYIDIILLLSAVVFILIAALVALLMYVTKIKAGQDLPHHEYQTVEFKEEHED